MKFKGTLIASASGRLNGVVFSHNRGGPYIRNHAIPITPPTTPQTNARTFLTNAVYNYTNVLTDDQRLGWSNYAEANPVLDGQGNSVNIGGLGWYNRLNIGRITAALATIDDAPVVAGPAYLTPPTLEWNAGSVDVNFENGDPWASVDAGFLQVRVSRPVSPGIISAAGVPLQIIGNVLGDTTTPPTSPVTLPYYFGGSTGQKIFWQAKAYDAEGRVSAVTAGSFLVG